VRSTMRQLAQVMAFTHQQGITHRDIKPENVLLQDNGNIALCDFGISKDIVSGAYESTMNLSAAGTLAYCAPEAGQSQQQPFVQCWFVISEPLTKIRRKQGGELFLGCGVV